MAAYKFIIAAAGTILLFFLSILSFAGYESLKIHPDHTTTSGFNCLIATVAYAFYAAYQYNKTFQSNNNNEQ